MRALELPHKDNEIQTIFDVCDKLNCYDSSSSLFEISDFDFSCKNIYLLHLRLMKFVLESFNCILRYYITCGRKNLFSRRLTKLHI